MLVEVYRNLNIGGYSVRNAKTKRVVAHIDGDEYFSLVDCTFHVGLGGREKVLRTGVKNVHAYVRGYLEDYIPLRRKFRYDPFDAEFFYDTRTGEELEYADIVSFTPNGIYYK